MKTFSEFGLDPKVLRAVAEMGFEEATPIQEKTIPLAMEGRDLIGQAQTGTGKTAAFGLPLVHKISPNEDRIVALVMCPTRELAIQVAEEIGKLGRFKGIRSLPIYGGQDIMKQIRALKKRPQIIIGTPGRLLDHIHRKTIRLDDVQTVVLDEADEMLDMGFMEDIQTILSLVPAERHTMLFSATMPPNIQKLAQQFLRNPEHVSVVPKQVSAPLIQQSYMEVQEKEKFEGLCRLLDMESPELAIIFGRTKRRVDELTEALQKRGYSAEGLHGDLSQNQRDAVMRKFRDGSIDVLVATDVAARGLDVSGVTRHKIARKRLPSIAEAMEGKQKMMAERIIEVVQNEGHNEFKAVAVQLLEQYDSVHLLAAALKLLTGEKKDVEIELTPEEPIRAKKRRPDVRSTGRRISYGSGEQRVDRFRRQRDGKDYRDHRDFARDRRRDYDGGGSSRSKGSGV